MHATSSCLTRARLGATVLTAALAAVLVACGGGYGGDYMPPAAPVVTAAPQTPLILTNLVTDAGATALHVDPNLRNAWGIAFNPTGFVWVNDNATSLSTLYDGNGVPQSLVVATPAGPTGIVFNASTDFKVSLNGVTAASPFIFASENGAISAWSPSVSRTLALTAFDGKAGGSVYKGLALAAWQGANYLYAADFHNGRIDVFNATFGKATLPGAFRDPALPAGYAPFGIQAIGDRIYVAYAKRQASGDDEAAGAGAGVLDVFDTGGNFIKQLVNGGALNAPWGIALAPANFGSYSNKLLVANFGDGRINAYDPGTGAMSGTLSKTDGTPVVVDGLWGIAFGPGVNSQPTNTLFFTAGPGGEAHGLYGRIDLAP